MGVGFTDVADYSGPIRCRRDERPTPASGPKRGSNAVARRGATIIEALLYLSVAIGVIAFSGRLLQNEQTRQRNQIISSDVQMMVDTTQLYVAQSYDKILGELYAGKGPGAALVDEFGMDRLVDAGFVSDIFSSGTGGLRALYGQDYAVLHRAVLRSAPEVTVTKTPALEEDITELTDGIYAEDTADTVTNDELDLEVVLVSSLHSAGDVDPRPIEPQNGSRIIELTGRPAAGYVPPAAFRPVDEPATAHGAYGGWELSLEPYEGLPSAPGDEGGVIASIISLPVTGVVSVLVDARDRENLSRCSDLPPNTAAYSDCLAASSGNQLFSDLVFNAWDSDGDGFLDSLPSIKGLHQIVFGSAEDTNGDGTKDAFPVIDALHRINFGGAVPITGETTTSMAYSEVTNLFALSCHAADNTVSNPQANPAANSFEINCPTTRLTGTIVAESGTVSGLLEANELKVNGPMTIKGTAAFDNDVELNGKLTMSGFSTDLLDNVPIWSHQLSYTFARQVSSATVTKTIDTRDSTKVNAPLLGTCPGARSQKLEYALVGYKLAPAAEDDDSKAEIEQIYLTGSNEQSVSVTLGGKWSQEVTVDVLAQIFCR